MHLSDSASGSRKLKNLALTGVILVATAMIFAVAVCIVRDGIQDAATQESYVKAEAAAKDDTGISFTALQNEGATNSKDWITVSGTAIDYPLVQGSDNKYYLTHDAFGNENKAGAIFINSLNAKDLSDNKTIIFGHNQADGSMFSDLNKFGNKEWGDAHNGLTITSADGSVREYSLICYLYTSPSNNDVYVVDTDEPITETAGKLIKDADVVYSDFNGGSLVCLSTCKYHTSRSVAVFELTSYSGGASTVGFRPDGFEVVGTVPVTATGSAVEGE